MKFELDDDELAKLKIWTDAIKVIHGEVGGLTYTFDPSSGIGVAILVYSKLAKTTLDLTDVSKW